MQGILPILPPRANRRVPEHPGYRRYRDRNRIERMFGILKQQRRVATRYDTTAQSFTSFLNLAAIRLWLRSFTTRAWHGDPRHRQDKASPQRARWGHAVGWALPGVGAGKPRRLRADAGRPGAPFLRAGRRPPMVSIQSGLSPPHSWHDGC